MPPKDLSSDEINSRLAAALETIAQKQSDGGNMAQFGALIADALERLSQGQVDAANAAAQAFKKGNRPSNEVAVPNISAFNPRGDKDFPRPTLKCQMFIPWPAEPESLTREEIELLNILMPGEYMVTRNDNTKIKMICKGEYNLDGVRFSRLLLNHDTAFDNNNHRMMVPLNTMLRQIARQIPGGTEKAASVLSMDEEEALILASKLNDGTATRTPISVGE